MTTPVWSDKVSVVAVQRVANGSSVRGTLDISNVFGGYVFLRVGRLTNVAPAVGITVLARRILRNAAAGQDIPHPGTTTTYQDVLAAANLTTLSGTPGHPTGAVALTSNTGFGASQIVCVVNSVTTPTRAEWHRTSKLASSTLTFDRNMADSAIASGDTITNQSMVLAPVWFDGTPYAGDLEVIFDYGAETNASHVVVEAWAQVFSNTGL